ncbi:MAG TPA: hypothetical protein VFM81_04015, partial [Actinomycetota bacterium]|nr:hypothetical protein [Actinomycetota bacterium]
MTGRRLLVMLVVLAAIGIPGAVLTATCAGRSCDASGGETVRVPFCPLPAALKEGIANGFREGRSPDVLGVAAGTPVYTDADGLRAPWPATGASTDPRVPIVLAGDGVAKAGSIPKGTTLDRVAPTVSDILGFERPFPEVRSGTSIAGIADGKRPKLVLLIAWKGIGSSELESRPDDWPYLSSLMDDGAGTLEGATGSLPLDPAATLTTIGTGGLPSQHGITGSFVRNGEGRIVQAYAPDAPVQIIATLADDLDHANPSTLVGLIADDERDRGIVGGHWYPGEDPVDSVIGDSATAPLSVQVHLTTGYGADDVPDVIGVVLDGRVRSMDRWTREIVTEAQRATGASTLAVVAGSGSAEASRLAVADDELVAAVEDAVPGSGTAVAATVPGGVFLDQTVLR